MWPCTLGMTLEQFIAALKDDMSEFNANWDGFPAKMPEAEWRKQFEAWLNSRPTFVEEKEAA